VTQHNERIQQSFTNQGASFATQPWTSDADLIARLVAAAHCTGTERVLDIATGPGYIAEAFAKVAKEVIGIDLTDAMLQIAESRRQQKNIANLTFRTGDVHHLPFADGEFDVVVCRFAFHHFEQPAKILSEMTRVCRHNGTILIEDIMASEHPERAAYQDQFELLRDPSHTRSLPLSEFLTLFRNAGLEVETVAMASDVIPKVDRWMATTKTPPDRAAQIQQLLDADRLQDLSGTRPFFDQSASLHFHERTAILTGRKFR
jgi:ubiquinone/menaquinone biosynthesis C-methylase UbiE